MIEIRQNLALCAKTMPAESVTQSAAHQLDRYLLAILIVGTDGAIHAAHAAVPGLFDDFVSTDSFSRERSRYCIERSRRAELEKIRTRRFIRLDERIHFTAHCIVSGASQIEKSRAAGWFDLQRPLQDSPDFAPLFRRQWILD